MKNKAILWCAAVAAMVSGCEVYVPPPPGVVVAAQGVVVGVDAAPAVEVVPTAYVWDGYEYVGEYNGGYYYFGPTGVWITCDAVVWGRFHSWQGYHPDWRYHMIRNEGVYRMDHAHYVARGGRPGAAPYREGGRPAPRPAVVRPHQSPPQHPPAAQHRPQEEKKEDR